MKIYTGIGDTGSTMLRGGVKVSKTDKRVRAIGAVDELNAAIGLLISSIGTGTTSRDLRDVQNDLFELGAWLSDPELKHSLNFTDLESKIDKVEDGLPPLKNFILPGGTVTSSHAHMARAICRRAEIEVLSRYYENETVRIYLNRLSDYLFVVARYCNSNGSLDIKWTPNK
jgi:cob(I)alamin adenosyltransferase